MRRLFSILWLMLLVASPSFAMPTSGDPGTGNGSIGAQDATFEMKPALQGTLGCEITGTWAGTITFEYMGKDASWHTLKVMPIGSDGSTGTATSTTTANGFFLIGNAGFTKVRAGFTSGASYTSGTATIVYNSTESSYVYAQVIGGTVTVTPSGTQDVNTKQVNGVTTSTGAGVVGTGSQRVAIGQDSTTVAGSSSLPAGANLVGKVGIDQTTPGTTNAVSTTNLPTTVSTGTGTQGVSSPRVTVAVDSATVAGSASLPTGANVIGGVTAAQLPAALDGSGYLKTHEQGTATTSSNNWPTTVSTGTGAQGASSPRVTVATDTATIAGSAPGTAGSASANVVSVQGVASGTTVPTTDASSKTIGGAIGTVAQLMGGSDASSNVQALKVESSTNPNLRVSLYNANNEVTTNAPADTLAPAINLNVNGFGYIYNSAGSIWERPRSGVSTALTGAAGTALTAGTQAGGTAAYGGIQVVANVGVDPCQSSAFVKSVKAVTLTSSGILVTGVSTKKTNVCAVSLTANATPPTFQFKSGTGSTCGTGTTTLTGTYGTGITAPITINIGGSATLFQTAAATDDLCLILAGGTNPDIEGFITYVTQ